MSRHEFKHNAKASIYMRQALLLPWWRGSPFSSCCKIVNITCLPHPGESELPKRYAQSATPSAKQSCNAPYFWLTYEITSAGRYLKWPRQFFVFSRNQSKLGLCSNNHSWVNMTEFFKLVSWPAVASTNIKIRITRPVHLSNNCLLPAHN